MKHTCCTNEIGADLPKECQDDTDMHHAKDVGKAKEQDDDTKAAFRSDHNSIYSVAIVHLTMILKRQKPRHIFKVVKAKAKEMLVEKTERTQ